MIERKIILDYIFDNERPIYIQLVERLRKEIVSGKLKAGERLPSVRELALTTRVNPNTMQKALVELENEGLVYTERTNGKFVTNFLNDMKNIGITYEETKIYLQELGGNK